MTNTCFPLVRGRVMRATRLDECGRVVDSGCSAITTEGFVSVALTANITDAEVITVVNAGGKQCVNDTGSPTFGGYGVAITFCNVDPELYGMMTHQEVVYDADGDAVGFRMSTAVDVSKAAFALEVWSNVPGVACGVTGGSYGYTLLPFISGGIIGDFTLENAAVSFTLANAATKDGTQWANGPYDVVAGVGGIAGPLLTPMGVKDHLNVQLTTIAPPTPGCACLASGPAATGATSGVPGTWTPVDSYPPKNFTDLTDGDPVIVATPATAWTTGQYVTLEDASHAYWNGTAWVAGEAP
jgi:hypothetical protein